MAVRSRSRVRWQPSLESDFTLGIIRDTPRVGIPRGGVYDALDMLLHRPGVAFKRGGTSYAGPASAAGSKCLAVVYAGFPSIGNLLLALMDDLHLYKITAGAATDLGAFSGTFTGMIDNPTMFVGGLQNFAVFPDFGGGTIPWYYDGFSPPRQFQGGSSSGGTYALSIAGTPTGGGFSLSVTYTDPAGVNTPEVYQTAQIAYNASAATVVSAINTAIAASPNVATFSGSGGALPGTPVSVAVPATWAITVVAPAVSGYSLTGGSSPYASVGAVDGTAAGVPTGRFAATHLQRLVLANSYLSGNRIWYGPVINPTSAAWDTATSWIDMDDAVSGLCSLSNVLLVFSTRTMWRITGDTPPPNSNLEIEPIGHVGCTDARSIVNWEGRCIFANPRGIYITTGVGYESLMQDRIESYWQSLFSGYNPASDAWTISAGLYGRRFLFVTVLNGTTQVATLICDLPRKAWTRMSNAKFKMYAAAYDVSEELYAASSAVPRVVSLSGLFTPAAGNKNDADGTAVTCTLETRPLATGIGLKAFGDAEVQLDMRDAASDNPTLAVSVAPGVEATTYAAVTESPLAETTDLARKRVTVSKDSECVSVKLAQNNASSKTEIYGVEWNERPYGEQAEGQ